MGELNEIAELIQINPVKEEIKGDSDDLFTDLIDSQGTVCLDLPESIETTYNLRNDKYLVPVFASKSFSSFVGNGVMVGSYLITAAHVAKSKEENFPILYYKYEDEFKMVNENDVVFDGRNVEPEDGICNDLIVFKLNGVIGSFKCNDASVEKGTKLHTSFYTYLDNGKLMFDRNLNVVDSVGTLSFDKTTKWNNCFRVYNEYGFVPGNSGCAFYLNNVLYGILLGGSEPGFGVNKYTVLEASYIRQILDVYG